MRQLACALTLSLLLLTESALSQPSYAGSKQEFRGIWIATVLNYDWPLARNHTPQQQRDSLVALLDMAAAGGFNAVIFQVRPECDALYQSPYEPWSYWLTGAQGTAPSPLYDPLEFAVGEAHRRGLELHAWVNPYRAYRQDNAYSRSPDHVVEAHPSWVITCPDGYKLLNPGLPEVRNHVSLIVSDIVRRYDVDGMHFDDYFYPYPEHQFTREDSATWAADPRGYPWDSLNSWRRDNVNLLIHQVYDSIQTIKPWVKFGVSPFGLWKSGVPTGTSGMDAYNVIACDAPAWTRGGYVDYIIPQLYWQFGGGQDYALLQPWWAGERNGRHFYTGNAAYRITQNGWPASEIASQIRFNQTNLLAQGSVQFRALNLRMNDGGLFDLLRWDVFRYPSIAPVMGWKETTPPNTPSGLQLVWNGGRGAYELSWQRPAPASDGDTAIRYVIYRFRSTPAPTGAESVPRHLLGISGETSFVPPARVDSTGAVYSFAVSALDRNNNESPLTEYGRADALRWHPLAGAIQYRVQLDTLGTFPEGGLLYNVLAGDTVSVPPGLIGGKTYYWRVVGGGQISEGSYSPTRSFSPGWPLKPVLLSPTGNGVSRTPYFKWTKVGGTSFRVRALDYATRLTVLDTTLSDTSFTSLTILEPSKIIAWTVMPTNNYGDGELSVEGRFRTGTQIVGLEEEVGLPDRLTLDQNYPNPFNPTTRIRFGIPERSHVTLTVYDLLGRRVAVLQEGILEAGWGEREFDGQTLASGVYLCRIQAGTSVQVRRLLLVK
jgi:uncharacterized lipoprotein YddW (UPF0748 family)